MRTRWSTAEWRLVNVSPAIDIELKDGEFVTVTLEQARGIDPTDVESISIYEPNTEPVTNSDKYTNDAYLQLIDMWRYHGVSISTRPYL